MSTDPPSQSSPQFRGDSTPGVLYANPAEAAKAVRDDYLYWTGKLTDSSFQLSVALIAANWAVFGTVARVMSDPWAKSSISLAVLSVAVNLLGTKRMSEMHRRRMEYAEANPDRWNEEFGATRGRVDPWPFTKEIESWGSLLRWCKTWLPLIGGGLFFVAVILS